MTVATGVLPNAVVYVASKGAIEQAARSLAKDFGAKGITVNVVSPGPTDTPLFRSDKPEAVVNFIKGLIPSKRLGKPEEIAPVVTFLASPAAAWVNGQNIRVNGVRIPSFLFVVFLTNDFIPAGFYCLSVFYSKLLSIASCTIDFSNKEFLITAP